MNLYLSSIDAHIQRVLKKTNDFKELVYQAEGVYPTDIVESLRRLAKRNVITEDKLRNYIQQAYCFSEDDNSGESFFPHYLDSDWRFCKSGLEKLTELLDEQVTKENMTMVFMGTPKLFSYYKNRNNNVRCILYDKNASEYGKNELRNGECYDCIIPEYFDSHGVKSADIIIMDPPWYLEKTIDFLNCAKQISVFGTKVLCVIPPIYTRPSILQERDIITNFCNANGFYIEKVVNAAARYITPQFERNSLRVNGIFCDLKNWRVGDVLIVEKKSEPNINQKVNTNKRNELSSWSEVEIGKVRIKYKHTQPEASAFSCDLDSLFYDDVYPSVSKRYQTDFDINVWTSGNRVFHCNNIPLFEIIVQNLFDDMRSVLIEKGITQVDFDSVIRCQQKILGLVWKERNEYV